MNHLLGSFNLTDIPSQLAGVPDIRVSFAIDIDGMLNVSAIDRGTGNENSIEIEWDKRSKNTEETRFEVNNLKLTVITCGHRGQIEEF